MSTLYPDLTGTNFPNDLDTFLNYINITATDAPLIVQYVEAMRNGDYTEAQNILQQIPNATRKIIQATDLNKLSEAILALERFFKTDIQPYITEKQEEWQNIIDRFSYKGAWSSGTSYSVNNMVSYTIGTNEFIYIATGNPPIGTVPTNSQYWRLLTIQGQQGQSGPGWSYRQEWNSAVQYNTDNVVSYKGVLYQALRDTLGEQPDITPSAWKEVVQISAASYPIQPTEPANQQPGDLWFNTSTTPTQYVYLQPLDNPASASEIVNGYEAYDETGTKVVGTANYLPLSGGNMIGTIDMGSNKITNVAEPTEAQDVATKNYVDTHSVSGSFLPLTGGTLTGNLNLSSGSSVIVNNGTVSIENGAIKSNMGLTIQSTNELTLAPNTKVIDMFGSNVRNVATPSSNTDAANKAYVDQQTASAGGVVTGTYTGNGDETSGYTVNLGFKPKAVIIWATDGTSGGNGNIPFSDGGIILDTQPIQSGSTIHAEIVNEGFKVYTVESNNRPSYNYSKLQHTYIAFK